MRLIDADELHDAILRDEKLDGNDVNWAVNRIISHILNAPTIDSLDLDVNIGGRRCGKRQRLLDELRPKGKWLEDSGNIACTHCHSIWLYRKTDFCPNCGADMRREE